VHRTKSVNESFVAPQHFSYAGSRSMRSPAWRFRFVEMHFKTNGSLTLE